MKTYHDEARFRMPANISSGWRVGRREDWSTALRQQPNHVFRAVPRLMKHTEHVHIPDATLQPLGGRQSPVASLKRYLRSFHADEHFDSDESWENEPSSWYSQVMTRAPSFGCRHGSLASLLRYVALGQEEVSAVVQALSRKGACGAQDAGNVAKGRRLRDSRPHLDPFGSATEASANESGGSRGLGVLGSVESHYLQALDPGLMTSRRRRVKGRVRRSYDAVRSL